MSMWDFLNWLELSNLRKEVEYLRQEQVSNQKTLEERLKELFLELYKNENDVSKINLSEVSNIRRIIGNKFNIEANRTFKDRYSFMYVFLFMFFMFVFSFYFIKWLLLGEYISTFVKIVFVISGIFSFSIYSDIKITFENRKKYYSDLKSHLKTALYLKDKYSYLSPYGIYLKYVIDNSLKDVLDILKKNPSKEDPYKTIKVLYSLFDLEADTELIKNWNFFWNFDANKYKMLEGTFKFPKNILGFERILLIILFFIPIFLALLALRNNIYQKYSNKAAFLELNCYLNNSESCKKLANLYKTDNSLYIKYLKKACKTKDMHSCKLLGNYFFDKGNFEDSLTFYEKACYLGDGLACSLAGNIIEKKYHVYHGGLPLYKKACDLNISEACYTVGTYFYLDKSYDRAFSYLKRSCEIGNKYGCFYAGAMCIRKEVNNYGEYKNLIDCGLDFYNKSCNLKNGEACFILGYYFYKKGVYGVEKNTKKSKLYIKRACELNYTKACKYL